MSKGEATRQRIIEKAAPLFNQRGFEGCSMQDILEATGLQKGGLYRHFSNKEDLAAEAFRYALAQVAKVRMPAPDNSASAVENLRRMVAQFVEAPSPILGGCPILNTAIDADDGNPILRGLAREGLAAWRSKIVAVVRSGRSRGEIRNDVEPRALANMMIATLEGALMISRLEASRAALQDAKVSLQAIIDGAAAR